MREMRCVLAIRRALTSDATTPRLIAVTLPDHFDPDDVDAIAHDTEVHGCWIAELDGRWKSGILP